MSSDFNLHPARATRAGERIPDTCTEPQATNATTALAPLDVSSPLLAPAGAAGGVQLPMADVRAYLARRAPVARWELEPRLFSRLPLEQRGQVRRLQAAVVSVHHRVSAHKEKVQAACLKLLTIYVEFRPLKTFRAKYDLWVLRQDWLVLVNRTRAGAAWQATRRGLADAFLDYVAARMGEFKRGDAAEQAILSLHRQWQTGLTQRGVPEVIPGYEENWELRTRNLLPEGWDASNIRKQLARRNKFNAAAKALLHEGIASARSYLPQVHSTRAGETPLRFMELIQFDDVRCDFRVMDTESGQVNDLWLLVARDVATTMLLGFGLRPARAREDGTQEHLKLQDMKQLFGWMLETYGLPPYRMTCKIENGTATLAEATAAAVAEMLGPERIAISYASMIGGNSPLGYGERAMGNSKAKAMLESLNRLQHLLTSHFPGQIGLNYSRLPAEYRDRERAARDIWENHRPEDRAELRYPFYTIPQAREGLLEIFGIQNRRTQHDCEGFREIAEWFDGVNWQPQHAAPADMTGRRTRTRKESPIERAAWLLQECAPFTKVSPEIITAFYAHTQRRVVVKAKGEIELTVEGKLLRFTPPAAEFALAPETKCLGYFNPDDPRLLTLTDGRGAVLGTWLRRGLVKHGDAEALAAAIRYSTTALNQAKARATELAAGDAAQLEAMRAHNAGFVTVMAPQPQARTLTSGVAEALTAVSAAVKAAPKLAEEKNLENNRRRAQILKAALET